MRGIDKPAGARLDPFAVAGPSLRTDDACSDRAERRAFAKRVDRPQDTDRARAVDLEQWRRRGKFIFEQPCAEPPEFGQPKRKMASEVSAEAEWRNPCSIALDEIEAKPAPALSNQAVPNRAAVNHPCVRQTRQKVGEMLCLLTPETNDRGIERARPEQPCAGRTPPRILSESEAPSAR
nr:hypothetical protein [Sphingopyxis sp. YR583]